MVLEQTVRLLYVSRWQYDITHLKLGIVLELRFSRNAELSKS